MKAIHSYRSDLVAPMLESVGGAGVLKPHILGHALSAATISRYYKDFVLITDDLGKEMALACKMPYTDIISVGKSFPSDPCFWVHSKMYAYQVTKEPFIHFDNDIFLWEPLPKDKVDVDVVALHSETFMWYFYEGSLRGLAAAQVPITDLHLKHWTNRMPINMSVFGGNNYQVINKYADYVLDWLQQNNGFIGATKEIREGLSNHITPIEQLWVSYLIQDVHKVPIKFIVTEGNMKAEDHVPGVELTHLHGLKQIAAKTHTLHELCAKMNYKLNEINPEVNAAVEQYTGPSQQQMDTAVDTLVKEAQHGQNQQHQEA